MNHSHTPHQNTKHTPRHLSPPAAQGPNSQKQIVHTKIKTSFLSKFILLFVFITIILSGYLFWQHQQMDEALFAQQKLLSETKEKIEKSLAEEKIFAKTQALDILEKAQAQRKSWSVITRKIFEDLEMPGVIDLNHVQGQRNNHFSLSGSAKDIKSIARLIVIVKRHENFENPFVTELSQNVGSGVYNFSIVFDYSTS